MLGDVLRVPLKDLKVALNLVYSTGTVGVIAQIVFTVNQYTRFLCCFSLSPSDLQTIVIQIPFS